MTAVVCISTTESDHLIMRADSLFNSVFVCDTILSLLLVFEVEVLPLTRAVPALPTWQNRALIL